MDENRFRGVPPPSMEGCCLIVAGVFVLFAGSLLLALIAGAVFLLARVPLLIPPVVFFGIVLLWVMGRRRG